MSKNPNRSYPAATKKARCHRLAARLAAALLCLAIFAGSVIASETLITPPDSNSRIAVENTIIQNGETTVFFLSWPYLGDPQSGKPCPLNYYAVTVAAGLAEPRLETIARGVCGGLIQNGTLLASGEASILIAGNWEHWRNGEKLDSKSLASFEGLSSLGFDDQTSLPEFFDQASNGDLVAAVLSASSRNSSDVGGLLNVTRLSAKGEPRWKSASEDSVSDVMAARAWAGPDGGALIHASSATDGDAVLVFDRQGNLKRHTLSAGDPLLAMGQLGEMDPEQAAAFFQGLADSQPDSIEQVVAKATAQGGWDVLFERKGEADREGHFLLRIGPDGTVRSEQNLSETMTAYGVEDWFDFYLDGRELVLLSRVVATQKIINGRPRGRAQNVVSWIDLDSGNVSPHLIPLDERYLDAALVAGDADIQYLDGLPDSEPVLLSRLAGHPLVVSLGWVDRRQVLRLHEASPGLAAYTEAFEKRRSQQVKAAAREQRQADREAMKVSINSASAEAAGMSEKEFQALSEDEQTEAIIRNGGSSQLLQTMMQQSGDLAAQQQARANGKDEASAPEDLNAQIAAAMAEAQQEMANTPGITPEMLAQMQAAMGQVSQGLGESSAGNLATVGTPSGREAAQETLLDDTLALDPAGRAFIEFEDESGRDLILRVVERESNQDLFTKRYSDGLIYEYIDFTQFGPPIADISVRYEGVDGSILKELRPLVQP